MTEEIPKELLNRLRRERKEEYDEGYGAGMEYSKEASYPGIERLVRLIDERVSLTEEDAPSVYLTGSSEFQAGFYSALETVLEESAKEEESTKEG